MFKIYDLNYNEVRLPVDSLGYGLKSLDIEIGPIIYESVYTHSSRTDQLVKRYPKDRDVYINAMFTAKDRTDWRLKRDRVYEFFRNLGEFYIAETLQPFKLLKVIVDDSYTVDRPVYQWGLIEIYLKVLDSPFKKSLHTTLDIDSEGIRWNDKWGYGMGLSSENEQWKYSFEPSPIVVNLDNSLFEQGSLFLSNGQNSDSTRHGRLKNHYSVIKGQNYQLNLSETGGTVNYIIVFHYDASGNHIDNEGSSNVYGDGDTSLSFVALGTSIRLMIYANGSAQVNISGIGTLTKISLVGYLSVNKFSFYNAGTEPIKLIQHRESEIKVDIKSSTNWFEITDDSGNTFRLNRAVSNGDVLRISGNKITLNGDNVLGDTNGTFLTAKSGWNNWEILNLANFTFSIDFRYLYD